jgi:signal transduction histidine kinase
MENRHPEYRPHNIPRLTPPEDLRALSVRILHHANRGVSRIPFVRAVLNSIIEFSKSDAAEIYVKDVDLSYRCMMTRKPKRSFVFQGLNPPSVADDEPEIKSPFEQLCDIVLAGRTDSSSRFFTHNGSFWVNDTTNRAAFIEEEKTGLIPPGLEFIEEYKSIALIPFVLPEESVGLLHLLSQSKFFFTESEIEIYEGVAQTIGLAISDRRARTECNERVKELTCLYGIARIAGEPDLSLEETLLRIARLLPPAWQYPSVTTGRVIVDKKFYEAPGFKEGAQKQAAQIVVNGAVRGSVEVYYIEDKPVLYEGPFLKEERSLIDTVAREVALMIDRREAEIYKSVLQEQLRHADRLATLGQLAAGVAHELNEPIGTTLGFAQLALKCPGLPEGCTGDLEKIVRASLHAREVVRKMLIFSRQMPAQKALIDINKLIAEGLYFVESRCAKQQIELIRDLDKNVQPVYADQAQIHQVLVNLVVNAVQVMPDGGSLIIRTRERGDHIDLIVEDTGPGMPEEVLRHIFEPFFTTKDIGQGTGLGLSVVHGIVTSHGGSIDVNTRLGKGTTFIVHLPVIKPPDAKETDGNGSN